MVISIDESKIPSIAAALKCPVDVVMKCLVEKGKLDIAMLQAVTGISTELIKAVLGTVGALVNFGGNLLGTGIGTIGNLAGNLLGGLGALGGLGGGSTSGDTGSATGSIVDIDESKIPSIAAVLKCPVDVIMKCLIAKGKLDLAALNLATGVGMGTLKAALGGVGALIGLGTNLFGAGVGLLGNTLKGLEGLGGSGSFGFGGGVVPHVTETDVSEISKTLDVAESKVKGAMTSDGGLDLSKLASSTGHTMSSLMGSLGGLFGGNIGFGSGGSAGAGDGSVGGPAGVTIADIDESKIPDIAAALKVPVDVVKKCLVAKGKLDIAMLQAVTGISTNLIKAVLGTVGALVNFGGNLLGTGIGTIGNLAGNLLGGLGALGGLGGGSTSGHTGSATGSIVDIDESKIPSIAGALNCPVDVVMKCLVAKGKLDIAMLQAVTGISTNLIKTVLGTVGALVNFGGNLLGTGIGTIGNLAGNLLGGLGALGGLGGGSTSGLTTATNDLTGYVGSGISGISTSLGETTGGLTGSYGSGISGISTGLGEAIGSSAGSGVSGVGGLSGDVGEAVRGTLGGLGGMSAQPIAVGAGGRRYAHHYYFL
ncbi:hypothetical protein L596_020571 [Steinernema carpocapsae]|uniref:Uncharacterized protein n=1 Tax=Steinernema carpocapsae TaxID=34508 RepID=A0A4U5MTX8_STECR|nr:hypothetical protein L596_020571 [Steinernema carpocapsae]